MLSVETTFKTEFASKYLQQLCKHFAHKVTAEFTPNHADVRFPFAACDMAATADELVIRGQAEKPEALETFKSVIESHLVKFAWREDVTLEWQAAAPTEIGTSDGTAETLDRT